MYECRHPYLGETEVKSVAGENKKSEYRNDWIAKTYDRINLTVPKGQKEEFRTHAEGRGESLNGFILRAMNEARERDNAQE